MKSDFSDKKTPFWPRLFARLAPSPARLSGLYRLHSAMPRQLLRTLGNATQKRQRPRTGSRSHLLDY
ncbi:uncharacterized protein BKA78DRAFT_319010 [Phyllosticta capitalensis]|uniref:uncharacterized protein n=1 Tax=Phyllosticta capitalensis TaxID=121624 RepID=UPI00312E30B6